MPTPVRQDSRFEQDRLPKPIFNTQTITTFDVIADFGEKRRIL